VKRRSIMLIAGEVSGDALAAELVEALREKILQHESQPTADVQPLHTALTPYFFGAGGPKMAAAGVDLAFDLTRHSVIGVSDMLKKLRTFRRLFLQLHRLARERQPEVIIGVDYGVFNLRFARAIHRHVRKHRRAFVPWQPKLVQYVSPQVWASRPGRARRLAAHHDLLLSIFPFEKEWYRQRAPKLRVEFVGHPLAGRRASSAVQRPQTGDATRLVCLPGSRADEVRRHWPVVTGAFVRLQRELPNLQAKLILPDDTLAQSARALGVPSGLVLQVGGLSEALAQADCALAKSGTSTLECALAGVPAVVFYKTSWPNYWIGKRVVKVKYLAMPNLLAGEAVFPEFIQAAATPENVARVALAILRDETRRAAIQSRLATVVAGLGDAGASTRAAEAIVRLLY